VGKHRDRLRIIAAILDASAMGACKTRIMLQANLNFKLLEKYLYHAVRLGLLQVEGQTYSLTEQGRGFLNDYKHFHDRYLNAQEWLKYLDSEYQRLSRLCENP
jgi:predicted transcriptional regulator